MSDTISPPEQGSKMRTRKAIVSAAKARSKNGAWQAQKSQLTRLQILQATVRCLVKVGYAETLTETIAKEAEVSRGALMHHFKSRAEVFCATAKFIVEQRAAEFEQLVLRIHLTKSGLPDLNSFRETMQLLRSFYSSPFFIAHLELLRGSRSDPTLTHVLEILQKALDDSASESLRAHLPYWAGIEDVRDRLSDLATAALQGIAVSHHMDEARAAAVAEFLAEICFREFGEAYAAKHGNLVADKPRRLAAAVKGRLAAAVKR